MAITTNAEAYAACWSDAASPHTKLLPTVYEEAINATCSSHGANRCNCSNV